MVGGMNTRCNIYWCGLKAIEPLGGWLGTDQIKNDCVKGTGKTLLAVCWRPACTIEICETSVCFTACTCY
jgi:hypothetical protein